MPNKKPNATASVPGQMPSQGKVGYFALSDSSGDDDDLPCVVIGTGNKKKSCGYMGYRTPQGSPAKAKARSPLRPSPVSSDGSFSHVSHASHASGPRVPRMPNFRARRENPMDDVSLPAGVTTSSRLGSTRGIHTMRC